MTLGVGAFTVSTPVPVPGAAMVWPSAAPDRGSVGPRAPLSTNRAATRLEGLDLLRAGKIKPLLDRSFPLSDAPVAHSYIDSRHVRGSGGVIP